MLTFHQGDTMMDGTTTPSALRTPAEGVWRHATGNSYTFRMKSFTFDAQNVSTGWSIISGELTVDHTGDAFAGPATVEIYNPNRDLVTTLCADSVGTRFDLRRITERPLESIAETQPKLHPALLGLSAMISQYFTRCRKTDF
jgi:hypothetical protein